MEDTLIAASTSTKARDAKTDPLEHTSHVRAYPYSPRCLALQIRSAGRITDHGQTVKHCFSTAHMAPAEVRTLRDALTAWLAEHGEI